jgi:hypothetical protein
MPWNYLYEPKVEFVMVTKLLSYPKYQKQCHNSQLTHKKSKLR